MWNIHIIYSTLSIKYIDQNQKFFFYKIMFQALMAIPTSSLKWQKSSSYFKPL